MNRDDLKNRIRDAINDPSSVIFSETQLNDLIDEAAEFLVAETRSVKRSAYFPLREGHFFYSTRYIAPDLMLPYRVWSTPDSTRLGVTSMEELDKFQERWLQTTTADPELWFPVSWDMIGLWPGASAAGGVMRVDYFAWPRSLQDDTDEPELLLASQDALVLYGTYMGLLKKWDAEKARSVFKQFSKHEDFAKARSGVLRIGHKSFSRNPSLELPSTIRSE